MSNLIIKPLVYADIDLNIIDGSAIWVTSILETLAQDPQIRPAVLLKRPILRDVLTSSLEKHPNLEIINPWSKEFKELNLSLEDDTWKKTKRLTPAQAANIIDQLDVKMGFSMFLVRGYNLSKEIASTYVFSKRTWFYLTDFPQEIERVTDEDMHHIRTIYKNSSKLALQTPHLITYFKGLLNIEDEGKFLYLPPMVPNSELAHSSFSNKNNQLIYSGKFAPFWKAPEMFLKFAEIDNDQYKFIVIGDKFHNYPYQENYQERVTEALNRTKNVFWKKGLSRAEVQNHIQQSDVGVSWRHSELDKSKELSTKVLEFGLHGKPVIINKNTLHIELFGEDYPLYANSGEEYKEKIVLALTDPDAYELAAKRIYAVSEKHMFKNIITYLKPMLINVANDIHDPQEERQFKKKKILFAGHDLKFAKMLIDYFKLSEEYLVKEDNWKGHNSHDESKSKELLDWADIIIAEWGLGNAVWYSKHKKAHQVLIVRMHLQEKDTKHPPKILWDNVDQLIFIAPGLKQEMESAFNFLPKDRIKVIYNLVDGAKLNKDKLPGSEFNIGLMGISPSRKRLDLALDIFEKLWMDDSRYTLFIKGHLPNKYAWLWNRPDEKSYYENVFRRINSSKWRDSVVFEGWGDVSEWYRKLRFILSPSDFESFHLAVAEGMASGCFPIIRNWFGSEELYPEKYIFKNTGEAVNIIKEIQSNTVIDLKQEQRWMKDYVEQRFDKSLICKKWDEMIKFHYSDKVEKS